MDDRTMSWLKGTSLKFKLSAGSMVKCLMLKGYEDLRRTDFIGNRALYWPLKDSQSTVTNCLRDMSGEWWDSTDGMQSTLTVEIWRGDRP